MLESPEKPHCYIEVKNVTLRRNHLAEFPDSITSRGTKHLGELTDQVMAGNRAVMFYLVQREDCRSFAVADDIDAAYAKALADAMKAGVEVLCYQCKLTTKNITLDIPVIFGVLTDNTLQQAKDRSGGKHGNKGVEVAITAIKIAYINK